MTGRASWQGLALLLLAPMAWAQAPQLTPTDYARAESRLAHRTTPLVDNALSGITWLEDGSVWFKRHDASGDHFERFQPPAGKTEPLFDHALLAAALSKAGGKAVTADKLPITEYSARADGGFTIKAGDKRYACSIAEKAGRCTEVKGPGSEPGVLSPDGKREAFIRNWNLWLRDAEGGNERQLTTDGVVDYGYATDNAGWVHSDRPILVWSPDSRKIATFQQDQRKTSTMTLVATNVGAPRVEQWKYPFVGDKDITMIERVVKLSDKLEMGDPIKPGAVKAAWTNRIVEAANAKP